MSSSHALGSEQPLHHSTFADLQLGISSQSILARLLRYWDSPNVDNPSESMGITLLFLDEKDSMLSGFIPANQADDYRSSLQEGDVYEVAHFEVERCPHLYKLTENTFVIRFIAQTTLVKSISNGPVISLQKFMLRKHDHLQILANTNLELPDVVGQIQSVKGYGLTDPQVISPLLIRFLIEPTVEVYLSLWDDAAATFKGILNSEVRVHTVMVVTTVNPTKIGDKLYLNSTPATKLFFCSNLPPITEFTSRLRTAVGEEIPSYHDKTWINDTQLSSIGDLNMFLSNTTDQVPYFICKARIVEILTKNGWFYVSCTRCNKKIENSAASLRCNQCLISNVTGVVRYCVELLVDDGNNYATFVVFDKEMLKLTNQDAATLFLDQVNRGVNENLPQCIADLGGQEFLFHVRVTPSNPTPINRTFTVAAVSHTINPENPKINEHACVDVKCEEASTSASASKTSTAEVKQGGRKHPRD
ncbi:uncharacterized protein LOC106362980 [Brassica napus]|nr:uncharacterized protein LOC106362980 [Brassica napus]